MLDNLRLRLASVEISPLLALLGLCCGILAGGVIILFRLTIESVQVSFLPGGLLENYEALSITARLIIASLGGLLIGLLFQWIDKGGRQVGVVHVMERLAYHQAHLPLKNAVLQFVGAAISLICGHSAGREGPGIHLGAASGSLVGQWLTLPNNSIRALVACGIAAAIAASFNMPIAGVVFAMEVVMLEYTIAGFAPVILAAVSATVLTRWVFGPEPAFIIPNIQIGSLSELPFIILIGISMGILASLFINLLQQFTKWSHRFSIWQRMTIAGVVTGCCAIWVPEIMGVGYDTVNSSLLGQIGMTSLLSILLVKMLATTFGLGFGLPGGLIGPTIVIGAVGGAVIGLLVESFYPAQLASIGYYAMLGMGAMMAATLQAPLAALMALLELTANPDIILPAMLAVIIASMTSNHVFKKESVFMSLLKARGLDYQNDPVTQSLRRVGVASVMDPSFVVMPRLVSLQQAKDLLNTNPAWVLIQETESTEPKTLLLAADLVRYINSKERDDNNITDEQIDLLEIPAQRYNTAPINIQATLQEAVAMLKSSNASMLYVARIKRLDIIKVYGVLTSEIVNTHYRY
ncbi:MAG: chloride channel protein [Gammaproteobacteria bacterium]|nr:chloride channel protein [Gammaproteobacteria bacterium]